MTFNIEFVSNHTDHADVPESAKLAELTRYLRQTLPNFEVIRSDHGWSLRFYKEGHPIVLGSVRYRPGLGVYEVESRFFKNNKTRDHNLVNVSRTKDLVKAAKLVQRSFITMNADEVAKYMTSTIESNLSNKAAKVNNDMYTEKQKFNKAVRELNNGMDQYRVAVGQMEFPEQIKEIARNVLNLQAEATSIETRTCSLYLAVFNELNGKPFADTALLGTNVTCRGLNIQVYDESKQNFVFTEESAPDWFRERIAKLQLLDVGSPIMNIGCKHDAKVYTLYVENEEDKVEVSDGTQ